MTDKTQFPVFTAGTLPSAPSMNGMTVLVEASDGTRSRRYSNGVVWTDDLTAAQVEATQALVSQAGNQAAALARLQYARPLFAWILGDRVTGASILSGASASSWAVDLGDAQDGTIVAVTTGGTSALTYQVSEDGAVWSAAYALTAGAAGTYSYRLSALAPGRYLRITLTASVSTVTARVFWMGSTARAGMPTRYVRRPAIGDGGALLSLAAAGTIVCPPIDLRRAVRGSSALYVTVGSGTVKVSAQVSRDGVINPVSVGDLLTGMTVGVHRISLDGFAYGNFITLTVTETAGGAATVGGHASLALADERVGQTNPRRVAIVMQAGGFAGAFWTTYAPGSMKCYRLLDRLGYDVEFLPTATASTAFDGAERLYEFAVVPTFTADGLWATWTSGSGNPFGRLVKGATATPAILLSMADASNAQVQAAVGAFAAGSTLYQKALWGDKPWYYRFKSYTTINVQAHMTETAAFVTDAAGLPAAWKFKGAAGWVYACAGATGGDFAMLPLAMAEAINAGHISPPPRKVPAVIDLDDMPDCGGINGTGTVADMNRVYAAMTSLQMPCSFGIRTEDIQNNFFTAEMKTWLSSRTADKGGLLYPIVHRGTWTWAAQTKSAADGLQRTDIALSVGAGIRVGSDADNLNAWGYTYANNNAWSESGAQLMQPGSHFTSSPANTVIQAGYGLQVMRTFQAGGANTASIGAPGYDAFGECWYRGIRVVDSTYQMTDAQKLLDFDDGSTGSTQIAFQFARFFNDVLGAGMPLYIHGSNCYDGHDSGNAPGTRWLEMLAGIYGKGMNQVCTMAHGSVLAAEPA